MEKMKKLATYFVIKYVLICEALKRFVEPFDSVNEALTYINAVQNSRPVIEMMKIGEYPFFAGQRENYVFHKLGLRDGDITGDVISVHMVDDIRVKMNKEYDAETVKALQDKLDEALKIFYNSAITNGISVNGTEFVLADVPASKGRNGDSNWIRKDLKPYVYKKPQISYREAGLTANKVLAANGYKQSNAYPAGKIAPVNNGVCLKHGECETEEMEYIEYSCPNGEFNLTNKVGSVTIPTDDGSKFVKYGYNGVKKARQTRSNHRSIMTKAAVFAVKDLDVKLVEEFDKMGVETPKDIYGDNVDMQNIFYVSTDKTDKAWKTFKHRKDVAEAQGDEDGEEWVMNIAHIKNPCAWYAQMLQFVYFNEQQLKGFLEYPIKKLIDECSTVDGIIKMLGNTPIGKICAMDHRWLSNKYVQDYVRKAIQEKIWRMMSGKIQDRCAYNAPICPDPKQAIHAFACMQAGKTVDFDGLLHKGEFFSFKKELQGKDCVINRAPSTGFGSVKIMHCLTEKEMKERCANYEEYLTDEQVFYMNSQDLSSIECQWDFDYDKVTASCNEHLVSAVKRTRDALGIKPVVQLEDQAKLGSSVRESVASAMMNMVRNNLVGKASNVMFKLMNRPIELIDVDMTYACDVYIRNSVDAVKLAAMGSVPKKLLSLQGNPVYRVSYMLADEEHSTVVSNEDKAEKLLEKIKKAGVKTGAYNAKIERIGELRPWSTAFRFATCEPGNTPADLAGNYEPKRSYNDSGMIDRIAQTVEAMTEDVIPSLAWLNNMYDRSGSAYKMIESGRIINTVHPGFWKRRKYDKDGNAIDEGGLFQQVSYKDSAIRKALKSEAHEASANMKLVRDKYVFDQVKWLCHQTDATQEELADEVAYRVFNDDAWDKGYYVRNAMDMFGEIFVENMRKRVANANELIAGIHEDDVYDIELADIDDI